MKIKKLDWKINREKRLECVAFKLNEVIDEINKLKEEIKK